MVRRKLENSADLLDGLVAAGRGDARRLRVVAHELRAAAGRLMAPEGAASLGALMGVEGAAASAYFGAFATAFAPALGFTGRNRRPPRDPVNVCLSIGYTMLQFEALRAVTGVGLDPAVGVYHEVRPGRDSLACDLVEALRPAVDGFVHDLFAVHGLRPESFSGGGTEPCRLGKAGRTLFYRVYEESAAAGLRDRLAADAAALAVAVSAHGRGNRHSLAVAASERPPATAGWPE
jgi:CRISPR-associated protein Cas1